LAGRIEIFRLHPLAQAEFTGNSAGFFDTLLAGNFKTGTHNRLGAALAERIVAGGYPAALARASSRRRAVWYRDYMATMVQRDVRDLTRISALNALPRLLMLAAGQTAHLLNVTDLASPFQLSRTTIRGFYHFRNKDGVEVDIVLEVAGRRIAGIEVKASATVTSADFRGLRKLKEAAGAQFTTGVVLYDGEATLPFGDGLFAVPIRSLWEIS